MWANLTSFTKELAERGATMLAELDERIEDEDEDVDEDFEDESSNKAAKQKREEKKDESSPSSPVKDDNDSGEDDIDVALPNWATKNSNSSKDEDEDDDGNAKQVQVTQNKDDDVDGANRKAKVKDVRELQAQLAEVKAMRQELRKDVSGQMQEIGEEIQGKVMQVIAKTNSSAGTGVGKLPSASMESANQELLKRAQEAERRLSVVQEQVKTLQSASRVHEAELEDMRESHAQVSAIKKQLQNALQEKEEAEMTLSSLTKMQSLEREELTQQVQDLESKASSERQYGMNQASEVKAARRAVEELEKKIADMVESHRTALQGAQDASKQVEDSGNLDDLKHCALQQQVLEETQAQLDSYIKNSAESSRLHEQLQLDLVSTKELLASERDKMQQLFIQLENAVKIERELQGQLSTAHSNCTSYEAALSEAADLTQSLDAELKETQLSNNTAQAALAAQLLITQEQERTMSFEYHEVQKKLREVSARLSTSETSETVALEALRQAEMASAAQSKEGEASEHTRIELEQRLEALELQYNEQARVLAESTDSSRKESEQSRSQIQAAHERTAEATALLEKARLASEELHSQHRVDIKAKEDDIALLEKRLHDYLSSAEGTDSKLQQELTASEQRLSVAREELTRERARADAIEASSASKNRDLEASLAAQIAAVEDSLEQLRVLRADSEAQAYALVVSQSEKELAQKEVQNSLVENQEILASTAQLHQQTLLSQQLEHKEKLDALEADNFSLKSSASKDQEAAQQQLENLTSQLRETQSQLDQAQQRAGSLETALAEATSEFQKCGVDMEHKLAAKHSELEQTLGELQTALDAAETSRELHERTSTQQQQALQVALAQIKAHEADHSSTQTSLHQELAEKHSQLEQALKNVEEEKVAQAALDSSTAEQLRSKHDELDAARLRLQGAEQAEAVAKAELASLREIHEGVLVQLSEARSSADQEKAASLSAQRQYQDELSKQRDSLEREYDAHIRELKAKHDGLQGVLQGTLQEHEAEVARLQREADSLLCEWEEKNNVLHDNHEAEIVRLNLVADERHRELEENCVGLQMEAAKHETEVSCLQSEADARIRELQKKHDDFYSTHKSTVEDHAAEVSRLQGRADFCIREWEEKHNALLLQSQEQAESRVNTDAQLTKARLEQEKLQEQWVQRVEALELAAQDRTLENVSLRERVREAEASVMRQSDKLQKYEKDLSDARNSHTQEQEQLQLSLDAAQLNSQEQSQALADAQNHAESVGSELLQLRSKLQFLESLQEQLGQAQEAAAAAEGLRIRAEDAEMQLSRLEQKKGRDLEALRTQNARISSLQQEVLEARELQNEAEGALSIAHSRLEGSISPAILEEVQQRLETERADAKRLLERYEDLQVQVSRSAAANGGQANGDEVAAAQTRVELSQARDQLSALLEQARIAAIKEVESEKTLNALRNEIMSERVEHEASAVSARAHIQKLDAERDRLVSELSENVGTKATGSGNLHGSGSRQRGSIGAAGTLSPSNVGHVDLESGGGANLFANEDDDDRQRKSGDPIPAVINTIWRVAARYPIVLQYIGESPPRLGALGRWLAVYLIILHLLLLLGIV